MTLYKRSLVIFGVTLVGLLIVLYFATRLILMDGFSDIERAEAAENSQRALNTINDDIASLAEASRDWARSSDTYALITSGDSQHIGAQLADQSSWTSNGVNAMLFVDASGQIVYQAAYDLNNAIFVPVPVSLANEVSYDAALNNHPEEDCAIFGIVQLPEGPMMVTSVPVVEAGTKGPVGGNLIWGRYLDESEINRIEQITLTEVSLERTDAEDLPADMRAVIDKQEGADVQLLGNEAISSYSVIDDINGDPALVMRVETPRNINNQARESVIYLVIAIFALGLIFGIGIIALLHRMVVGRLQAISSRVRQAASTGDISIRLDVTGDDELGMLAADINRMFAALELSHKTLGRINLELEERVQEKTERLHQKIEVLQTLTNIDQEIIAAESSEAIQDLICHRVAELMRVPKALVVLKDNNGAGRVTASYGLEKRRPDFDELEQLFDSSLFEDLARSGDKAVGFDTVTAYNHYLPELIAHENAHSLALAPLVLDGRQLGALLVFDVVPRQWGDDETQVLGLLAGQVALGINTARLFEEEKTTRQELASLYQLSRDLSDTAPDIDSILSIVTRTAVETINITYCRIALLDGEEMVMRSAYPRRVLGQDLKVGYSEPLSGLTYCKRVMQQNAAVVLSADKQVLSCYERDVIFLGGAKTVCLVPLRAANKVLGMMILGEAREEERAPFTASKLELANNIGDQASSTLNRAELFSELEHAYMQTVLSLANAVDARDSYTNDHGQVMAHMAMAIGRMYNMSPLELESLHYASLLHDVGKIGVADAILKKPADLDEVEWTQMRKHPAIGEQILSPMPYLEGASLVVRHHHEHYDGSGYPDQIAGDAIPLGSRILAIVDSYCAMRDQRVYKEPVSHEVAVQELLDCSGTQFDPRIVKTFIRLMESGIINIQNRLGHHLNGKTAKDDTEAA